MNSVIAILLMLGFFSPTHAANCPELSGKFKCEEEIIEVSKSELNYLFEVTKPDKNYEYSAIADGIVRYKYNNSGEVTNYEVASCLDTERLYTKDVAIGTFIGSGEKGEFVVEQMYNLDPQGNMVIYTKAYFSFLDFVSERTETCSRF